MRLSAQQRRGSRKSCKRDAVAIRDFGVFKVIQRKERKERKERNPKTGEEITIPVHKKAIFKQGKAVKEKVNVL